ncbi:MAG: 1-acyl-sn-glycerol-3-phosphate acyltransferase [Clostridiales bacterium 38_11]|nr:MAG: 1-acyl-sn-glycerol-3-phosphate acyltransferase [Clostridiales bacterium 38_11]HBH11824.1 1-acyl-sn-glycerol-3-phosphate acyltransferase [Clostridiales bacterium]
MFYKIVRAIIFVILNILFRIKVHHKENSLNNDGEPLVLCANHSSWFDPFVVAITFKDEISYMAKKELFENSILRFFLTRIKAFPVDRDGNSLTALKNSLKILKNNKTLGIFPEGTRVKGFSESSVKGGIGMLVVRSKATVLPVYIESKYKLFGRVDIYYGERFDYNHLEKGSLDSKQYTDISIDIMRRIYAVKNVFMDGKNGNN